MRKKLLAFGVIAVGVLVITLALVVSMDFASPELGEAALEQASKATGMELSAAGVHLNLLRGLTLEAVEASWRFPGIRLEVRIDEIVFEHRLVPLLSGTVVIERVVVRRPRVKLVEARDRPPSKQTAKRPRDRSPESQRRPAAPHQVEYRRLVLQISELQLDDGSYTSAGKGGGSSPSMEGIDCLLHNIDIQTGALSLLHGLTADGEFRAKEIALESRLVQDFAGRLEASGGRLVLDDLSFTTYGSPFLGSMKVDFNTIPFRYTLGIKGGPLDVGTLAGSASPGGFGNGFLELEAEGLGAGSKNIKGKGKVRLESGTLASIPLFSLLEETLGQGTLVGSAYRATDVAFRLEKNHLLLDAFSLETGDVGLDLSGSVDLDGPLDLRVVLKSEQGRVAVPFQVTGTVEEPVVRVDASAEK